MPNRAQQWATEEALHSGVANIVERDRNGLVFERPGGVKVLKRSVAWVHDRHGREIDTDLDDTTEGGFVAKARAALDYDVRISEGGYRYYPRDDVDIEYVEFGRPLYLPVGGNPGTPGDWVQVPLSNRQRISNRIVWDAGAHSLEVKLLPHGIKVNYTLTDISGNRPIAWPIELVGLTRNGAELSSVADGIPVMWLTAPKWRGSPEPDGEGGFGPSQDGAISWQVQTIGSQAYVVYSPPDLTAVQFPVVIDPSTTVSPTANGDDGRMSGTTWSSSSNPQVGDWVGTNYYAWFRFPSISIAGTDNIYGAELTLVKTSGAGTGLIRSNVYGIDEDNHTAPTSTSDWNTDHGIHTTATATWDFYYESSGTTQPPNVGSIVTEIIGRGGWSSGNAIGIHIDDDGSSSGDYQLFDDVEGTTEADLTIYYGDYALFVDSGGLAEETSPSTLNIPYPSTVNADDGLLMVIGGQNGNVPSSTPTGWTLLEQTTNQTSTEQYYSVYYKSAAGTESGTEDVGMTSGTDDAAGVIYRFYGDDAVDFDSVAPQSDYAYNASSGAIDPPSLAATNSPGVWLAIYGGESQSLAWALPPSGWLTLDKNVEAAPPLAAQVLIAASWDTTTTVNPASITPSGGSGDWVGVTVAIPYKSTTALDGVGTAAADVDATQTRIRYIDGAGTASTIPGIGYLGKDSEVYVTPNADVAATGWETAPTASQSLYAQMDETPPSDTDYIYGSAS